MINVKQINCNGATFVDKYHATAVFSKNSTLTAGIVRNRSIGVNIYKTILSFNLSDLKPDIVESATLYLFVENIQYTGTSFKNMIIYDLAVLNMTNLPILIHDSYLLKQIADMPLEKLLQQYNKSKKQIFIALDKIESYTIESQRILKEKKVLELSDNGNELFGYSWSNKTK